MWELDYKESWVLKNWCFWTVVLEKTLECPLDCKEIQPVRPKGDHSSVFIGRTDAKTETPIFWPPHAKNWLIGKDSDAGTDWGQEEKGTTEDEMAGWHHRLDTYDFGWTPGVDDGQGGLECCDSQGCKELDTTERLNWTAYQLNILNNQYIFMSTSSVKFHLIHLQFSSVISDSLDPTECSTPSLPVHHHYPELAQTPVHWVSDDIWPFHLLSSPSPPVSIFPSIRVFFQWVRSLHHIAKVLEFQLSLSLSNEYSGLISFRMDWLDLSRVFSNTTVQKHQFFGAQLSLFSNSHIHTWLLEKP